MKTAGSNSRHGYGSAVLSVKPKRTIYAFIVLPAARSDSACEGAARCTREGALAIPAASC